MAAKIGKKQQSKADFSSFENSFTQIDFLRLDLPSTSTTN